MRIEGIDRTAYLVVDIFKLSNTSLHSVDLFIQEP